MNDKTCILVSSCDAYSDTWNPFFTLFKRYWPDCPFSIYVYSEKKSFNFSGVKKIFIGKEIGWGDALLKSLDIIKCNESFENVLLMLDDFLLFKQTNTELIKTAVMHLEGMKGQYLRLIPKPPPNISFKNDPLFGKISPGTPYRLSLQASIWNINALADLTCSTDTPWDLELIGSQRSKKYDGFYSSYTPILHYINGIERSLWTKEAIELFKNENITIDVNSRGLCNNITIERDKIKHLIQLFVKKVPLELRLLIRIYLLKVFKCHNR